MKKISIDKKYLTTIQDLTSKEVKEILISLLSEQINCLNGKARILAQIIYNENFIISESRKRIKKSESYPHFLQNSQNLQNSPHTPLLRTDNNINYINNQVGQETTNIFHLHKSECKRVAFKSESERLSFKQLLKPLFEESCVIFNDSDKTYNILIEIIDTLIEAKEEAQLNSEFKFKSNKLNETDIFKLTYFIDLDLLNGLVKLLANKSNIANRPYYILSSLINYKNKVESDIKKYGQDIRLLRPEKYGRTLILNNKEEIKIW